MSTNRVEQAIAILPAVAAIVATELRAQADIVERSTACVDVCRVADALRARADDRDQARAALAFVHGGAR